MFLDADYLSFLETLKQEVQPLPSAEVYLEQQEANKQSMKGVFLSYSGNAYTLNIRA